MKTVTAARPVDHLEPGVSSPPRTDGRSGPHTEPLPTGPFVQVSREALRALRDAPPLALALYVALLRADRPDQPWVRVRLEQLLVHLGRGERPATPEGPGRDRAGNPNRLSEVLEHLTARQLLEVRREFDAQTCKTRNTYRLLDRLERGDGRAYVEVPAPVLDALAAGRITPSLLAAWCAWTDACGRQGRTRDRLRDVASRYGVGLTAAREHRAALVAAGLLEVLELPGRAAVTARPGCLPDPTGFGEVTPPDSGASPHRIRGALSTSRKKTSRPTTSAPTPPTDPPPLAAGGGERSATEPTPEAAASPAAVRLRRLLEAATTAAAATGQHLAVTPSSALLEQVAAATEHGWTDAAMLELVRSSYAGAERPGAVLRWRLETMATTAAPAPKAATSTPTPAAYGTGCSRHPGLGRRVHPDGTAECSGCWQDRLLDVEQGG